MAVDINTAANRFTCNGKQYVFVATLMNDDYSVMLNNDTIKMCEFSIGLNDFYPTATIDIADHHGQVDRFIGRVYSICDIAFGQMKEIPCKPNPKFELDKTKLIYHTYFIDNIEILDRVNHTFTYRIHLVSYNKLFVNGTLDWTNYDKDPEPVTEIMKKLIKQQGFKVDDETFGLAKSKVKINYITGGNDTLASSVKYLMHRMYYELDQHDDQLKFLWYNWHNSKYYMLDLFKRDTFSGAYNLFMSVGQDSLEGLQSNTPIQLGSINKLGKSFAYKTLYDKDVYKHDLEKNEFKKLEYMSSNLVCYYNKIYPSVVQPKKMPQLPYVGNHKTKENVQLLDRGTTWNNHCLNIYHEQAGSLTDVEGIVVHVPGEIMRKPGNMINILVDRNLQNADDTDPKQIKEFKQRYQQYEGTWFVSKVRCMIEPSHMPGQSSKGEFDFTQNLSLCRNFYTKPDGCN